MEEEYIDLSTKYPTITYKEEPWAEDYQGQLPFEIIVYPTQEQQRQLAAKRALEAEYPNMFFGLAQDLTDAERINLNIRSKKIAEGKWGFLDKLFQATPYNCINTATNWITNGKFTIAKNKNLQKDPKKYGFTPIPYHMVEPGDLMQYMGVDGTPWHAAVVTDKNGNTWSVKSSTGDTELNDIRTYNIKEIGTVDSDLDTKPVFYRYTYPNSGVNFKYF